MNQQIARLDRLKPSERPFSDDPATSFTLPASWYYDPEIYDREKHAIFYRSWHYVCHFSQVADRGDYFTTRVHDQNLFVIQDDKGDLSAYFNVCQHRGHELVRGSGRTQLIVCPYQV